MDNDNDCFLQSINYIWLPYVNWRKQILLKGVASQYRAAKLQTLRHLEIAARYVLWSALCTKYVPFRILKVSAWCLFGLQTCVLSGVLHVWIWRLFVHHNMFLGRFWWFNLTLFGFSRVASLWDIACCIRNGNAYSHVLMIDASCFESSNISFLWLLLSPESDLKPRVKD